MIVALVLLGIVGVILIFACCKVSGDCSRQEEEEERREGKMAELKPCPFCGGKKIGYSIKTATSNYQRIYHAAMYCAKCHCYGARVLIRPVEHSRISVERNESYKRKAIEAWNRRAEDGK